MREEVSHVLFFFFISNSPSLSVRSYLGCVESTSGRNPMDGSNDPWVDPGRYVHVSLFFKTTSNGTTHKKKKRKEGWDWVGVCGRTERPPFIIIFFGCVLSWIGRIDASSIFGHEDHMVRDTRIDRFVRFPLLPSELQREVTKRDLSLLTWILNVGFVPW